MFRKVQSDLGKEIMISGKQPCFWSAIYESPLLLHLSINIRSSNGRILVVSSTDGYCSIITFNEGELGEPYQPVTSEAAPNSNLPSSFQTLLQGEILQENVQSVNEDFHLAYEDTNMTLDVDRPTEKQPLQPAAATENKIAERSALLLSPTSQMQSPRRVQLITLSSPKAKNVN